MASNFLQWNPTQANQESDAAYASDPQRVNGALNNQIFNDQTANKLFYQMSTFVAAFAQMLVNKGYNPQDSNLSTLVGVLSSILTQADGRPDQITVPWSPNPNFDCAQANGFRIDLAGDVTSSTLSNCPVAGHIITFFIVSLSPGNYSFAWPPNVQNPPNVKTQSTGNLLSYEFISDGGNLYSLSTFLEYLQAEINTLNSQVATNTANIAGNTANITTLEGEVAGLMPVSTSGSIKFPDGTIFQWFTDPTHDTDAAEHTRFVNFPASFPNNCFSIQLTTIIHSISGTSGQTMIYTVANAGWTTSGVTIYRSRSGSNTNMDTQCIIFAIGN